MTLSTTIRNLFGVDLFWGVGWLRNLRWSHCFSSEKCIEKSVEKRSSNFVFKISPVDAARRETSKNNICFSGCHNCFHNCFFFQVQVLANTWTWTWTWPKIAKSFKCVCLSNIFMAVEFSKIPFASPGCSLGCSSAGDSGPTCPPWRLALDGAPMYWTWRVLRRGGQTPPSLVKRAASNLHKSPRCYLWPAVLALLGRAHASWMAWQLQQNKRTQPPERQQGFR